MIGKLKTPFKHFTAIANEEVVEIVKDFDYKLGKAYMGMKTRASSAVESADMIKVIGKQIRFNVTGNIQVYETESKEPQKKIHMDTILNSRHIMISYYENIN